MLSKSVKYYFLAILVLLTCIMGISCSAQEKGYIVTNNNDTIKIPSIISEPDDYNNTYFLINHYNFKRKQQYLYIFEYYNKKHKVFQSKPKKRPDTLYEAMTRVKPKKIEKIKVNEIKYLKIINLKHKDTSIYIPIQDTLPTKIVRIGGQGDKNKFLSKQSIVKIDTQYVYYNFWKILHIKCDFNIYIRNYAIVYTNFDYSYYYSIYLVDIAIFSGKIQKAQIYNGGDLTLSQYRKEILKFINKRYNLNLTSDELLNYISPKQDIEHQTKLFDFILDKETALEQKENAVK